MKYVLYIYMIILAMSCNEWEEHYQEPSDTMQNNILQSIANNPEFRDFLNLMEKKSIDTIFNSNNAYTIFIPNNEGINEIISELTDTVTFIQSHITNTIFLTRNVETQKKLRTLSGKYALIEESDGNYYFNETEITHQSNLHANGIYYTLNGASRPMDNLFQYVEKINPYIAAYIESQDSTYLDLERSKPIDINDNGEIIYDSVMIKINLFELLYFPISEEFRNNKATLAIPTMDQYLDALEKIKTDLGLPSNFQVPLVWQYNVLMPFILNHGLFEDVLNPEDFEKEKLENIIGDSVLVSYMPENMFECSNGVAYEYDLFEIPDSLYLEGYRVEGESLVESKGLRLFAWKSDDLVRISGNIAFSPNIMNVNNIASNDSVLFVNFGANFTGEYSIEFKIENVFPGQYQFIWRSNPRYGGVYSVYINDELQTLPFGYTEFDLYNLKNGVVSVTGNDFFYPQDGYNKLDCLTSIETFGEVWIKLVYIHPGKITDNGLIMDYVELIPYN